MFRPALVIFRCLKNCNMLQTYWLIDEGIPQTEAQNRQLCPQWVSQQNAILFLDSINQLIFVMETQCYFPEVGSLEHVNEFRTRLLNMTGALSKASLVKAWIYDTVTYYMECDYRRGLKWWMDLLTTSTTRNYSATANPYNSQNTTELAKHFSACCVFTRRSLAMASNSRGSSASRAHAIPGSQLNLV
jgi:hypothetical protein